MSIEANRATVEKLWMALSARDWETLKSCLAVASLRVSHVEFSV